MKKLTLLFAASALLFSLMISGCGAEESTGVTDDEIVIGSWGPLDGPAALWGAVPRGMDAYFKHINEQGGIHGRQIRFIYRNDGYEPPRTVSAVRQMVQQDQVFAFVGGVGTSPGMAVRRYILDRGIPWVSPASGSTHWAYPPNDLLFSTYPLYVDEAAIQVEYAVEELGFSKIGIIYQSDDYGKGGLVGAEMQLEEYGLEIVASVSTEIGDTDLNSHARRLQNAGAEAVLLWVLPSQATNIIQTSARSGFRPQWIASSTLSDMQLMYDITDGLWEGTIFTSFGGFDNVNPELLGEYREALAKHQPNVRFGAFSAAGFLFAEPVVEALRIVGPDLTRESFVEALESLEGFQGIGPEITFGPDIRQGTRSAGLLKCISATEFEELAPFRTSNIDVEEAIRRMQ